MGKCYNCGAPLSAPIYRSSECGQCSKDAKVCLNCRFYDKNSYLQCRESISEGVGEKDRANFCDYFVLNPSKEDTGPSKSDEAANNLNKLFGD